MNKQSIAFLSLTLGASVVCNAMTFSNLKSLEKEVTTLSSSLDTKARSVNDTTIMVEGLTKEVDLLESQYKSLIEELAAKDEAINALSDEIKSYEDVKKLLGGSTFR